MARYFEFDVSLTQIHPRIWRRFLLSTDATFHDLHEAIQSAFSWEDRHLWVFRMPGYAGRRIAAIADTEAWDEPVPDAAGVRLASYFGGGDAVQWCEYLYDFGDDWLHEVKLYGVREQASDRRRMLLDGDRAAPPEDCGGLPGYERAITVLKTGKDPFGDSPRELKAWLGSWRPDIFDARHASRAFDR